VLGAIRSLDNYGLRVLVDMLDDAGHDMDYVILCDGIPCKYRSDSKDRGKQCAAQL
jgi:hypothetical protein